MSRVARYRRSGRLVPDVYQATSLQYRRQPLAAPSHDGIVPLLRPPSGFDHMLVSQLGQKYGCWYIGLNEGLGSSRLLATVSAAACGSSYRSGAGN
jgi:hypothetical protein